MQGLFKFKQIIKTAVYADKIKQTTQNSTKR